MQETSLWSAFNSSIPGHHIRIENAALTGTADLNYCLPNSSSGWIEGKYLDRWPRLSTTKIDIGIRGDQCIFLRNRAKFGKSFILLRVEEDQTDYLFPGSCAVQLLLPGMLKLEFIERCFGRAPICERLKPFLKFL